MAKLYLEPIIKPDKNKLPEAYEVVADVSRKVGSLTVWVPKFFQYDGSSLPAPAWHVITTPYNPRIMLPAVFHDWIYHTHQVSRKTADTLLYDMLIEHGFSSVQAWIVREAVDSFGKSYWKNDGEDDAYIKQLTQRIKADGRDPAKYGLPPKP